MKRRYISLIIIMLLAQNILEAQILKRKGLLGITMQTLNDSIVKQENLKITSGVLINTIMPNSTFFNLGVKEGDVLSKLNGVSVATVQDVLAIISPLYEGDKIEADYYSENKRRKKDNFFIR